MWIPENQIFNKPHFNITKVLTESQEGSEQICQYLTAAHSSISWGVTLAWVGGAEGFF